MSRVKSALSPEVTKVILESYSVVKKRSALWFFKEELAKKSKDVQVNGKQEQSSPNKIKSREVVQLWKTMDPESKREYFNKAEFDEVRYKEQKALWVAEVGSILAKNGNRVDKLIDAVPSFEKKQKDILESLEKYQKNIEHMIQAQTTRTLYKDVIVKSDRINPTVTSASLISAVPKGYRPLLHKPRRPPPPFILFASKNKDKFFELQETTYKGVNFLKIGAILWNDMDKKTRQAYEDEYSQLMKDYEIAMRQFREANSYEEDNYLDQASKEKKAFTISLRRKLRQFSIVPVNIRNAFNFFLMENKNIPLTELTETWRNLPESEKLKYRRLSEADSLRYYNERKECDDLIEEILRLIKKSRK